MSVIKPKTTVRTTAAPAADIVLHTPAAKRIPALLRLAVISDGSWTLVLRDVTAGANLANCTFVGSVAGLLEQPLGAGVDLGAGVSWLPPGHVLGVSVTAMAGTALTLVAETCEE